MLWTDILKRDLSPFRHFYWVLEWKEPVFDQIFIKTTGNLRWLKHINYFLQACAIFFLETDLQTSPEYDDKKIEIVPGWQLPETLAAIVWKIVLVDNWLSTGTFDFSKINFTCFSGRGGIAITLPNFFTRTWYNQSKCLYLKRSDIPVTYSTHFIQHVSIAVYLLKTWMLL